MGALRQPRLEKPKSSVKKPPAVAREEFTGNHGRDPQLPSEKLRARSKHWAKNKTGFAPVPIAIMADLPRLSSGHMEDMLVMTVLIESYGRPAKEGESSMPEWTPPIDIRELAQRCGGDPTDPEKSRRQMLRLLNDVDAKTEQNPRGRGMIEVRREARAKVSLRLRWQEWQSLPDYREWLALNAPKPVDESPAEEDVQGGESPAIVKGTVRLLGKRPAARVAAGGKKSLKVECGVKAFEFINPLAVDLEIDPVVEQGRLIFAPRLADEKCETREKSETPSNQINNLDSRSRRGCREVQNSTNQNTPNHPLVTLFDPLLQRFGSPLLSFDESSLQNAINELGEMPQEFLVHWVLKPGGRGERAIKTRSIPAIVREARQNWAKQQHASEELGAQLDAEERAQREKDRRNAIALAREVIANPRTPDEDREQARANLEAYLSEKDE